jgi:hypothetical protein
MKIPVSRLAMHHTSKHFLLKRLFAHYAPPHAEAALLIRTFALHVLKISPFITGDALIIVLKGTMPKDKQRKTALYIHAKNVYSLAPHVMYLQRIAQHASWVTC